jgi:hypothetical protein
VLHCVVLALEYRENQPSHKYIVGKGRNILMAFSGNYRDV